MEWIRGITQWFGGKEPDMPLLGSAADKPVAPESIKAEQSVIPNELLVFQDELNSYMQTSLDGMSIENKRAHFEVTKAALLRLIEESEKHPGVKIHGLNEAVEQLTKFWESIKPPEPKKTLPTSGSVIVAILDTETTGLEAHDEPISVAALLFEVALPSGKMLREMESFYGLREPSVSIHPRAQEVHGISIESLRGKVLDVETLRRIVASADVLIAHNAKFDRRMLMKVLPGIEKEIWSCSMLGKRFFWEGMPSKSLDSICVFLEVNRPEPHNALSDCRALSEVLFKHSGSTTRSKTYMGYLVQRPWAPPT